MAHLTSATSCGIVVKSNGGNLVIYEVRNEYEDDYTYTDRSDANKRVDLLNARFASSGPVNESDKFYIAAQSVRETFDAKKGY